MPDELRIPIIDEAGEIVKRSVPVERVSVRTSAQEEHVVLREELLHESVEVTRIAVGREVSEAPPVRTEGEVTIIPVLEERLVVEKRLFLIEELHLRKSTTTEPVEMPAMLRHTHVEIERTTFDKREND